jgi:hypothetical protein
MAKEVKPCVTPDCSRTRLYGRKLCYQCLRSDLKKKKEEKIARKKERKIKSKKFQKSELKKWHAKTWKVVSEYVRRSNADWRGMVKCYTCPDIIDWREANCGHFLHQRLDFDLRNLKPQCPRDNLYLSGRLDEYAIRLVKDHGLDWVEQLKCDAAQHKGYDLIETMRIYYEMKEKLSKLPSV